MIDNWANRERREGYADGRAGRRGGRSNQHYQKGYREGVVTCVCSWPHDGSAGCPRRPTGGAKMCRHCQKHHRDRDRGTTRVEASLGDRRLTLDPLREIPIQLVIREVESTIPCGLGAEWASGSKGDVPIYATAGAGFGSEWATIHVGDKDYCFTITQIVEKLLEAEGIA